MDCPKCPRCGLPESWPDQPCQPMEVRVLASMARDYWARMMKGTEGAWREAGAHTWSTGRRPA